MIRPRVTIPTRLYRVYNFTFEMNLLNDATGSVPIWICVAGGVYFINFWQITTAPQPSLTAQRFIRIKDEYTNGVLLVLRY